MERRAKSLQKLLDEVNFYAPNRAKTDDGWIGDKAHMARDSAHNVDERGIVHAQDITHDPKGGLDSYKLAEALKASGDKRLRLLISNGRIWNLEVSPDWRPYNGKNKHDRHVHVEVKKDRNLEDDMSDWTAVPGEVGPHVAAANKDAPAVRPLMKFGSTDMKQVDALWALLKAQEPNSFGRILEAAVKEYQREKGLTPDGKVGSYTWGSLTGE